MACAIARIFSTGVIAVGLLAARAAQSHFSQNQESEDQKLNALLSREWEYELRDDPGLATIVGDNRYNDRWKDYSLNAEESRRESLTQWREMFRGINGSSLSPENRLNRTLMLRNLNDRLAGIKLKNFEMPVNPHSGVQLEWLEITRITPFRSLKDYEDYLSRLRRLPNAVEQIIQVLQQGLRDKLAPPRFLLEKTAPQCQNIATAVGITNPFSEPLMHMPSSISQHDAKRLRAEILDAVNNNVRPAYSQLASYIIREYAPRGRLDPGVWSLPNGDLRYRFAIQRMTTTDLDPETIHKIGLKEVARIEQEETEIAKRLGFRDLPSFRKHIRNDSRFIPQSAAQLLGLYRSYIARIKPLVPDLTHFKVNTPLEIRSMESIGERSAASAKYLQGSADGSRPGILLVNTSDLSHRTTIGVEATAFHEGIPGHHLQIFITQQLSIPAFRKEGSYTAYTEGWALYAENLAKELGFYKDPYSDYGRLSNELLRAIRLVVDTGVHYDRWTRQQVIDYFHQHSSEDEPTIQSETDRYIAQPAQALAYKIGENTFLELRRKAKARLGPHFDIKYFHDEILGAGSIPLDILSARVDEWIQQRR